MVTSPSIGERWAGLAALSDAERRAQMRPILEEVLALEEGERSSTVEAMVAAEYALDDAELRPFTASRLRTWLAIAEDNMDGAVALARGYDGAFERLGGAMAFRRSTTVQAVARHELTSDEVKGLFDLIPSIVRQVPRTIPPTKYYEKPEQRRPFWKLRFW